MLIDGLIIFFHGIPLIYRNDNSFAPLMGNPCNLGILFGNAFGSVNHNDHNVCPLHCRHSADNAKPFQLFLDLVLTPQTRGINKYIFSAIPDNLRIYGVPGGSCDV